jgi:uncharacterized protein (DUF305 family)
VKHTSQLQPIRSAFATWLFALVGAIFTLTGAHANAPAPDQAAARFEVRFMQEMIDHHTMAVHMSHMCHAKAVHQELRAMCEEIITEQQQEIDTMQQWLATWYGISNYEPRMQHGAGHMNKLAMLNNAEFEIEFMKQMIRHHRMAVVMASQCVDRASHPQLQEACEDMITSQIDEIRTMQEWLCNWYGICRPRRQK